MGLETHRAVDVMELGHNETFDGAVPFNSNRAKDLAGSLSGAANGAMDQFFAPTKGQGRG